MENNTSNFEELSESAKDYIKTQVEIIGLKTTDKVSLIASFATLGFALSIVGVLALFFACLAVGFYLGELLGSNSLGFCVLAAIFLLVFFVLLIFRKKIILVPLRNKIIKEMLND